MSFCLFGALGGVCVILLLLLLLLNSVCKFLLSSADEISYTATVPGRLSGLYRYRGGCVLACCVCVVIRKERTQADFWITYVLVGADF